MFNSSVPLVSDVVTAENFHYAAGYPKLINKEYTRYEPIYCSQIICMLTLEVNQLDVDTLCII